MRNTNIALALCALLTGCASAWINEPSPATRNLVNDLRLDGFECKARHSDIECVQIDPLKRKQASKCDSTNGCVEQPTLLIYNRYRIKQEPSGIPSVQHDVIEQVENKLLGGKKVMPQ